MHALQHRLLWTLLSWTWSVPRTRQCAMVAFVSCKSLNIAIAVPNILKWFKLVVNDKHNKTKILGDGFFPALAGSEPLAIPPPIPSKVLGAVLKNIWRVVPSARPVRPTRRRYRTLRRRIAVKLQRHHLVARVPELGTRGWPDRRQKWKHPFKTIEGCYWSPWRPCPKWLDAKIW